MQRWMLGPDVTDAKGLALEDVAMPEPGPGELRVRVNAVSLNARDLMILAGPFGRIPGCAVVPGSDVAGRIDKVGPGVEGWVIGDRVVDLHFRGWNSGPPRPSLKLGLGALDEDGVLAECIVLPADRVERVPATLTDAEAATLPCAAVTAWNALHGDHPITAGSRMLILGTGSVSLFALQFARAAGADVTMTSRDGGKAERLRAIGAARVIDSVATPQWGKAVFEMTNGGAHKVVNTIGVGALGQSLAAARHGGEVAMVGLRPGDAEPLDPSLLNGKATIIRGISVGSASMYRHLAAVVDMHAIRPVIGARFGFDRVRDAYAAQASDLFGKVVIEIA